MIEDEEFVFCFSQLKIENLNGKKDLVLIKEMMLISNVLNKNDRNLLYKILILSFFSNIKKKIPIFFFKRFFEKKFDGIQNHHELIIIMKNILII